jgi:AcrR family transcriptional regulator
MPPERIDPTTEVKPGPGRPRDPDLETRRKAQILEVAQRVFAAHGFANTRTQTIANHVGVGNATVYRYFPTKDRLFLAAVEQGLKVLEAEMDAVLALDIEPVEMLKVAIERYLSFFHRRPEMAELFIQERAAFPTHHRPLYFVARDEETQCKHAAFFQRLIESGRVRPMPQERLFSVVGDLLYGTILTNLLSGRPVDPELQARDVTDVILNGILTPETRVEHAVEVKR